MTLPRSMWSAPTPAPADRDELGREAVGRYRAVVEGWAVRDWRELAGERLGFEETTRESLGD